MARKTGRVLDLNDGDIIAGIYRPLLAAKGVSGRAQQRITRHLRLALWKILVQTVHDARNDGSMPYRTGRGYRQMLRGVRVYGTRFHNIRAHIIGPDYMVTQEKGATIRPVRAKALTVPLEAALKADGSPKLPGPRSWQNIQNTFIYRSKETGRGYIAYKSQGRGLVLLYALVDEVELRSYTGFMANSWKRNAPKLMAAIGDALMTEMSAVDLMGLMRVTHQGKRGRKR